MRIGFIRISAKQVKNAIIVVGATGEGKTTLCFKLIGQNIAIIKNEMNEFSF